MQGLAHGRTPDRTAVQKLPALIGNPRSPQQLTCQLPIFGCLGKKVQ